MTDMKLSDQLGAMAIIDSLYAQQIALEEHLNLPELRQRIASRIREYYQQNGVSINDELIEQGVASWFANRLRYQAPEPTFLQKSGAFLYMTSGRWLRGLGLILLAVVLMVAYVFYAEHRDLAQFNRDMLSRQSEQAQIKTQAAELAGQLASYQQIPLAYAARPVADIIEQAQQKLNALSAKQQAAVVSDASAGKELLEKRLEEQIHHNYLLFTLYDQALTLAKKLPVLLKDDRRLSTITRDPHFPDFIRQAPELSTLVSSAALPLAKGDELASAKVDRAVAVFNSEITRLELFNQLAEHSSRLTALKLSPTDKKAVAEQIAAAKNLLATLTLSDGAASQAWADTLQGLDDTYRFIITPLTLVVVDRVGEKSGVERTYDASGGKSWYLIAEAQTAQGTPFPMRVKDSETGVQQKVATFGIRISQAEYEKLKNDKLDDGHVDNYLVGKKPANQLSIDYVRPVQPGRILSW